MVASMVELVIFALCFAFLVAVSLIAFKAMNGFHCGIRLAVAALGLLAAMVAINFFLCCLIGHGD